MTDMIERVARAVCLIPTSADVDDRWKDHVDEARAAIEALRSPTDDILTVGAHVINNHPGWNVGKLITEVHNAMIDAILEKKE